MTNDSAEVGERFKHQYCVDGSELGFRATVESPGSHKAVIFKGEDCPQTVVDQTILWFTFPEEALRLNTPEQMLNSGPKYYSLYMDPERDQNMVEIVFYHCSPDCFRSCSHNSAQTCVNAQPVLAVIAEFEEPPELDEAPNGPKQHIDPAEIYLSRLYPMSLEINHILLSSSGVGLVEHI